MIASLEEVVHPGHAHLHPMRMVNGWTCNRNLAKLGHFLSWFFDVLVLEWNDLHHWLGCVCFPCQQLIRRQAMFEFLSQPRVTLRQQSMVHMPADPIQPHHVGDECPGVGRDSCLFRADPGKSGFLLCFASPFSWLLGAIVQSSAPLARPDVPLESPLVLSESEHVGGRNDYLQYTCYSAWVTCNRIHCYRKQMNFTCLSLLIHIRCATTWGRQRFMTTSCIH